MLESSRRYRDERGLYRTWLAPQHDYRCIDPGRDPNPTDIAIQMHVYLMLRELHPTAAQNLCDALQRSFLDDDVWIYYVKLHWCLTFAVPNSAQSGSYRCRRSD